MNEIPRDETVDLYSADEKWVRNEIFGDNSMLVYLLAWPVAFVMFLLWPIVALIIYIIMGCIILWCGKDMPKDLRKFLVRGYIASLLLHGFFCLLDQITFGEINWISKKAKSLALKYHEYKRVIYSV